MSIEETLRSIGSFVAVFSEDRSRVLMVQHSYNNGKWSLPGGGLEPGEDDRMAAEREVLEETHLIVRVSRKTKVGTFWLRKSAGVVYLFIGEIIGGELFGQSSETVRAEFVPVAEIDRYDVYPAQRYYIERAIEWRFGDIPLDCFTGDAPDCRP